MNKTLNLKRLFGETNLLQSLAPFLSFSSAQQLDQLGLLLINQNEYNSTQVNKKLPKHLSNPKTIEGELDLSPVPTFPLLPFQHFSAAADAGEQLVQQGHPEK